MSNPANFKVQAHSRTNRRLFWLSFFVAAIAALFGWSAAENTSDLRTCELAVDALNEGGDKIDIRRVSTASLARVVRIDYSAIPAGHNVPISRYVSCRFSSAQTPPYTIGLSSVDTENGPLPDSNLYLLRRFYLDTKEARNTSLSFAPNATAGLANIAAHCLEWLVSVVSKAAIYSLLASLYLCFANRLNISPRYRTLHGATMGILAVAGATVASGVVSALAIILSICAGLVSAVSLRLVTTEDLRLTEARRDVVLVPWLFFSAMIGLALFWFPTRGALHTPLLPAWLLQPKLLFTLGGHGVSITVLSALLSAIAILWLVTGIGRTKADSSRQTTGALRHINLVFIPVLAGIVTAFGFLQYGMAVNPFLLCTKAALIAIMVLALSESDRHVFVLPISLAVVSFEYAIAPFLEITISDAATYALLVGVLLMLMGRHQNAAMKSSTP